MGVKIDQDSEVGEYDSAMQTLLQLIWGEGFLSPGGADEVAYLLEGSDIRGCKLLDIGAGLGAIDQLLVTQHGVGSVVGIDVDPVLLKQMDARIARAQLADRIKSLCVTPGPLPFESESFDIVFSKDAIVHIPDKAALYADIHRILRPGGRFIASDWLRGGTGAYSPEMTLEQCAAAVKQAGFVNVEVRDRNKWYFALAQRELKSMEGELKPVIIERIGPERAEHFVANWRQLVLVLRRGELRPGHLKAVKPAKGLVV